MAPPQLTLPVFGLNLVAFPGMDLPLHIFEERYRHLVRHLLAIPDPSERVFAVVAIREGYEVGTHESRSMYRTGCMVQLTDAEEYDDGRFDIMTVGRQRVRVVDTAVDTRTGGDLLTATVEVLPGEAGDPTPESTESAARALVRFDEYRSMVSGLRGDDVMTGVLPRDPEMLSFVLASTVSLTLRERQSLLESPTAHARLQLLRRLMGSEIRAMRALPSLPATEVARTGWNPN